MAVTVHIDVSAVTASLEEYLRATEGKMLSALEAGAKVIQAEAKRRAPVDTGGLKKSIKTAARMEGREAVATVGSNLHYAIHVEYGHRTGCAKNKTRRKPIRWIPGRYFLKGAFDSQRDRAVRVICARLRD